MNECNRWHFAHVGAPWKYSKCSRQSWYDMTWWTLHKCVAKELLVMAWALPPQTRFNDEPLASELFKFLLDTVWLSRWCFTDLVEEACGNVSVSRLWCWSVKVQPGANHAIWWYTSILCIHASTITPQVALWCLSLHLLEKWPQIWVLVLAWESASGNCILQVTSKSPKSLLSMPLIASADKPVSAYNIVVCEGWVTSEIIQMTTADVWMQQIVLCTCWRVMQVGKGQPRFQFR